MRKVSKIVNCKHRGVAHELVDDVRLRRVVRHRVMPNELGRVEHLECQCVQELSLGEQSEYRFESPAVLLFKERRYDFQLGYFCR